MSQQENIYELPLFKAHVLLLADIVADFMEDADPRSVAAACAFVERHQRPQKTVSKQ